jgi:hypothetical protein
MENEGLEKYERRCGVLQFRTENVVLKLGEEKK